MNLLLTGFEPFDLSPINPSEQVVHEIARSGIPGMKITPGILPVDRERGPAELLRLLAEIRPDAVLCLGEAARRPMISIERVAINLMDYRIPDNSGVTITDQPVVAGGPDAYFVTLPVRAMLQAVQAAGVPAELSLSAGAYLCNQVLYTLLHAVSQMEAPIPAGFIHLPTLPENALRYSPAAPSMSVGTAAAGVRAALLAVRDARNL